MAVGNDHSREHGLSQSERRSGQVVMDTATLYGLLHALTYDDPEHWPPWTRSAAYSATLLPLSCKRLHIPPQPKKPDFSNLSEVLIQRLGGFIAQARPERERIHSHAEAVNTNVLANLPDTRTRIKRIRELPSFEPWLEHAIAHFWPELSRLQSGLFDAEFIPSLASVLEVHTTDLHDVWERGRNPRILERWAAGVLSGEDLEISKRAYFVNNLLRGAFYEGISRTEHPEDQIALHPMRQHFLGESNIKPVSLDTNRTLTSLSAVLLASAMKQGSPRDRIICWCENLSSIRSALSSGVAQLPDLASEDARLTSVTAVARHLGLDLHVRGSERIVRGLATAFFTATGITFGIFLGPVVGSLASGVGAALGFTKATDRLVQVQKAAARRKGHIERLHELGGGRLIQMSS